MRERVNLLSEIKHLRHRERGVQHELELLRFQRDDLEERREKLLRQAEESSS